MIHMKITKKEIKECEFTDWVKTLVLDIEYTHKRKKGRILIKDYKAEYEKDYIKQVRKEVQKTYNITPTKWQ